MELLGLFRDIDTAAAAVENLRQVGFTEEQITSLSSVPYPDEVLTRAEDGRAYRKFALLGGAGGALAGFVLAAGTAWLYPVQTGDKPIISIFPTGIITYELMMLFAIIGAAVGAFVEMGLPEVERRVYAPEIANGFIGIAVTLEAAGQRDRAEETLRQAGSVKIVDDEVRS